MEQAAKQCMRFVIFLLLISVTQNVFAVEIASVDVTSIIVYDQPNGKEIGRLSYEQIVLVQLRTGDWAKIWLKGSNLIPDREEGWVLGTNLKPFGGKSSGSYSNEDCKTENRSGARVCLTRSEVELDCKESTYYRGYSSCEVEVPIQVSSDYKGNTCILVDVEIDVKLEFKTSGSRSWKSKKINNHETVVLRKNMNAVQNISLRNSFSSYDKVVEVRVAKIDSKIGSLILGQ